MINKAAFAYKHPNARSHQANSAFVIKSPIGRPSAATPCGSGQQSQTLAAASEINAQRVYEAAESDINARRHMVDCRPAVWRGHATTKKPQPAGIHCNLPGNRALPTRPQIAESSGFASDLRELTTSCKAAGATERWPMGCGHHATELVTILRQKQKAPPHHCGGASIEPIRSDDQTE
jgi:hypothetical protein